MTYTSMPITRGFYVVATLDRLDQLVRMLTSLKKHNKDPVMIMLANNPIEAHKFKARVGELTLFDATVLLDIDIYVNGNLDILFEIAERNKIGIYQEKHFPTINSGVIALSKELGIKLSAEWIGLFTSEPSSGIPYGDQCRLNAIIKKYPVEYLPEVYNFLIPEHTLDQEKANFNKIKIFHFLRHGQPSTYLSPAYNLWLSL